MKDDARQEEAHGLLDEVPVAERRSSSGSSFTEELKGYAQTRKGPSLRLILAYVFVAALITLPLAGFWIRKKTASSNDATGQIAIPLHPKEHATREPKTLEFNWDVTRGTASPDGVEKEVYLVNGEFPGPLIEARSGDRIIVHVHNGLESEGLALHWHGLKMKGYNAMDGASGYTQCPIGAGQQFVYDFKIGDHEHGTFWWHSHTEVQRGDGLYGGLVVHEPGEAPNDEALLLVGDWFHRKQVDIFNWYFHWQSMGNEPVPDSMIINGHGRYNCSMAVPARPVNCTQHAATEVLPLLAKKPGGPMKLRLVNVGTIAGVSLAVDGATLRPVAVDGGNTVKTVGRRSFGVLYPGERVDVMAEWKSGDVGARLTVYLDDENFGGFPNPALTPDQAFLAFPGTKGGDNTEPPVSPLNQDHCKLSELKNAVAQLTPLSSKAHQTILLYFKTQIMSRNDNKPKGYFNHTSWSMQSPPLLATNRSAWNVDQFVQFVAAGDNAPEVDIVLNNLDDGAHPIHLHGHSFQVLTSFRADGRDGWGSYNPYESDPPSPLNLNDPVVKDTVSVPRRGHVVIRIKADNPGLWMLHCHMLVHMGTGMVTGLQVGYPDDESHTAGLDETAASLCRSQ